VPPGHRDHGLPEAVTSMLRTIIVALFILTFVTQPMVIPSESMEHTLLVGDFLLMNRETLAPAGDWGDLLPYAPVERGEIVTFHSQVNPAEYLVKRVIGLPGDRLHIDQGRVFINGRALDEPYATFEPIADNSYLDHFPSASYTDPRVEPNWWKLMQASTENGELVIPAGKYFMMGDNRNHSLDSRYWGFVPRGQIIARPLVIYFSLNRPSRTDLAQATLPLTPEASTVSGGGTQSAQDDRLGHDTDILGQVKGFARWRRFFHVVH
jgi:signal peptidase I